jgi:hypothetical protein
MKSVNGMYIITTSTNHNGHQLPIIANHLHPKNWKPAQITQKTPLTPTPTWRERDALLWTRICAKRGFSTPFC